MRTRELTRAYKLMADLFGIGILPGGLMTSAERKKYRYFEERLAKQAKLSRDEIKAGVREEVQRRLDKERQHESRSHETREGQEGSRDTAQR